MKFIVHLDKNKSAKLEDQWKPALISKQNKREGNSKIRNCSIHLGVMLQYHLFFLHIIQSSVEATYTGMPKL